MKKQQKKYLYFFSILILFIFVFWIGNVWYSVVHRSLLLKNAASQIIKISPGDNLKTLAFHLKNRKLLSHPYFFIFLAHLNGFNHVLKIGEYRITQNMTIMYLLAKMVTGQAIQRKVLLVEGWTFEQYKEALKKNNFLQHVIEHLSDQEILKKIGATETHPEGLFFPDTYFFARGDSDLLILKLAYQKMQRILNEAWRNRSLESPYHTPYEALITASLIEKETASESERPLVAGVILQRLKKGMLLQIDPTLSYGAGKPFGPIAKEDLLSDNPYNTYKYRGLPPTPIDMPGKTSIEAALNPKISSWLYYVAKGNGEHIFSENYMDHKKNVQKYLRRPSNFLFVEKFAYLKNLFLKNQSENFSHSFLFQHEKENVCGWNAL